MREIVRKELDLFNTSLNLISSLEQTIISNISIESKVEIIDILIEYGTNSCFHYRSGYHILLFAYKYGCDPYIINFIIKWERQKGFSFNMVEYNYMYFSPLVLAVIS